MAVCGKHVRNVVQVDDIRVRRRQTHRHVSISARWSLATVRTSSVRCTTNLGTGHLEPGRTGSSPGTSCPVKHSQHESRFPSAGGRLSMNQLVLIKGVSLPSIRASQQTPENSFLRWPGYSLWIDSARTDFARDEHSGRVVCPWRFVGLSCLDC